MSSFCFKGSIHYYSIPDHCYLGSSSEVSAALTQLYQYIACQPISFQLPGLSPQVFVFHMKLFYSGPQTLWEKTQYSLSLFLVHPLLNYHLDTNQLSLHLWNFHLNSDIVHTFPRKQNEFFSLSNPNDSKAI